MTNAEFDALRVKWIENDINDIEDINDISLNNCLIKMVRTSRYELTLSNQGFDTNSFGENTFRSYITSPSVNFHDGNIELFGPTAYAVMLLVEDLEPEKLKEFDSFASEIFDAIKYAHLSDLEHLIKTNYVKIDFETGKFIIDAFVVCEIPTTFELTPIK